MDTTGNKYQVVKAYSNEDTIPQWEVAPDFNPESAVKPSVRWINVKNSPIEMIQGMAKYNQHIYPKFLKAVLDGRALADVLCLPFGTRLHLLRVGNRD